MPTKNHTIKVLELNEPGSVVVAVVSYYSNEAESPLFIPIREGHTESEPMTFNWGGPHEEGYSYTEEAFWADGGKVYSNSSTKAMDCDGRLDSFREFVWDDVEKTWEDMGSSQRDHTAESMGY